MSYILFILHFYHFAIYSAFIPSIFKENIKIKIALRTICLLKRKPHITNYFRSVLLARGNLFIKLFYTPNTP